MTFEEKCKLAKDAKAGDRWKNIKTGRECEVLANFWDGLELRHATGRLSRKQHHYFAYNYDPIQA